MPDKLRIHIEEISTLSDEQYDYVRSFFLERKIAKHRFLIQQGSNVRDDFFVLSGCLKAFHVDEDGRESIMRFAMENWWISDYQAYFQNEPATLDIACLEDCTVLVLSFENREKLCRELPAMAFFFRKKMERAYASFQQRMLFMLCRGAKERYEMFRIKYPTLLQRLPKSVIAAYLGISRETLSRISNQLS